MTPEACHRIPRAACLGLALLALGACANPLCPGDEGSVDRPADWTVESHCSGGSADYDTVFDDTAVHELDIAISAEDHAASWANLAEIVKNASGDLDALTLPSWYPVTVRYKGRTWTQVGMRYKGHASLVGAWKNGIRKLSFLLDFDKFADLDPNLANQRFYGFSRLGFANGYEDPALMRDKLAAEIFRAAGVPASRGTYAAVWLDWGEGRTYLGLYTVIEDAASSMLLSQFGNASGNLYKPWGHAARWPSLAEIAAEAGSGDEALNAYLATYFEKSTNEGSGYADVIAALEALHADRSDAAAWRAHLEEHFVVSSFLKTLAVSQVMLNWDSYGCKNHNYYVYADPAQDGRLVWFPWDLNETMLEKTSTECRDPGSILLEEITSPAADTTVDTDWPLIQYLLTDSSYRAEYLADVQAVLDDAFLVDDLKARMERYHALIAPYVVGPTATQVYPYWTSKADEFNASLTTSSSALETLVTERRAAAEAALAGQ